MSLPFDKTCPQCGAQAIASPKDARNWVWCVSCGYEGTMQQTQNIEQGISDNTKQLNLNI